ncbi:MAG: copper chaperone PCu(A)C [Gammaproteobacteria bacterium]|nr:copper chaperone PCu(A)C [Gammaproteobacteria bacterium]
MRALQPATLACVIAACSADSPPLIASNVVITQPMPGAHMSAGYLALANSSGQAITITAVSSPDFESVEMHESVLEDGVARMHPLEEITIPPHQGVVFERGAKHLMLMRPVDAIDTVTLQFYAGDALVLSINTTVGD